MFIIFLSLIISNFSLFFYVKTASPLKKGHPPTIPTMPLLKLIFCQALLPPFWQMQLMYFMYFTCSYELWLLQLKKWLKMIWDK